MKKLAVFLLNFAFVILGGCAQAPNYDITATTLPVYDFSITLCNGTDLTVGRLVTESVSCLHDYTLHVNQMRMIEGADVVVMSGVGLEAFLEDALHGSHTLIDASADTHTHTGNNEHDHVHHDDNDHNHEADPHIWLSPENAKIMARNIANELSAAYPEYEDTFRSNLTLLLDQLDALESYGKTQLADLTCRKLITFHDGFAYFAESFDLQILEAVEEEAGSEASAAEIIHLLELTKTHNLPAVFIEKNGSDAGAGVISRETGVNVYTLDMAMSGDSYFDAIYHNINTIKEALG